MSSLGESEIQLSTYTIGKARALNIFPESAIYPCLGITLGCTLRDVKESLSPKIDPIQEYALTDLEGELRLAEHVTIVGHVVWKGSRHGIRSYSHESEHQLKLVCDLDPWRLEKIEEYRDGKSLTLWLQLWPTIVSKDGLLDAKIGTLRMAIPQEKWIEFLTKVQHDRIEIIEVRFDPEEAERFGKALQYTKAARKRIVQGHYDEAVGEARKAVEILEGGRKKSADEDPLKLTLAKNTDIKRATEYRGIVSKLKQLTNLAHHDTGVRYSRAEAHFIVRTTENLVALVAAVTRPD